MLRIFEIRQKPSEVQWHKKFSFVEHGTNNTTSNLIEIDESNECW